MSRQCIKVRYMRPEYDNLREWMEEKNHVYVGRRGRVFITNHETKEKTIFHYSGSKWANPYKLNQYSIGESLKKYRKYLYDSKLIDDIEELQGMVLGCFCETDQCHAAILVELANK